MNAAFASFIAATEFCLLVLLVWAWPVGWEEKVTTAETRAAESDQANAELSRQLGEVRSELAQLRADDGRIVDALMERGRAEIETLEAHYRRQLPRQEQP